MTTAKSAEKQVDLRLLTHKAIKNSINECQACPLWKTRTNAVPFATPTRGDKLTIVGEAPGEQEDKQGKPFVGRSGQFLGGAIADTSLSHAEISIMNQLCCRPPGNRDPKPFELEACRPNFLNQLKFTQSWLGICVGKVAACNVLDLDPHKTKMKDLRGYFFWVLNKLWMVTWHPSYAMRNSKAAGEFRDDIAQAAELVSGDRALEFSQVRDFKVADMDPDRIRKAFKQYGWFPITTDRVGSIVVVKDSDVTPDPGFDTLPRWTIEELIRMRAMTPGERDYAIDVINHLKVELGAWVKV